MKKISQREAKIKGLRFYYTGVACPYGHIGARYVSEGICVTCRRDRNKDNFLRQGHNATPEQVIARRIASCKHRIKKRGGVYEDLKTLTKRPPKKCPCCGCLLDYATNGHHKDASPSLDRFDSSRHYTLTNVKIICTRCNVIKNSGTLEDHKKIVAWMTRETQRTRGHSD